MTEFTLYGLDEHGETASTERLRVADRAALVDLGRERLAKFHAVEIWEGPLCLLRLRRTSGAEAAPVST